MNRLSMMIAGLALSVSSAAFAKEPDKGASEADRYADQKVVQCRFERVTGTRTKAYRICLSEANWRRRMVAEREELEKLRGNDYGGSMNF